MPRLVTGMNDLTPKRMPFVTHDQMRATIQEVLNVVVKKLDDRAQERELLMIASLKDELVALGIFPEPVALEDKKVQ